MAKFVSGKPGFQIRLLDFSNLAVSAPRKIGKQSLDDVFLAVDRGFGLILNRGEIFRAQLAQGYPPLGCIDPAEIPMEVGQLPFRLRLVCCLQRRTFLLALEFYEGIIHAIR